jgi:hypothetical protein
VAGRPGRDADHHGGHGVQFFFVGRLFVGRLQFRR